MKHTALLRFLELLRLSPDGNVFNPWFDHDPVNDASSRAPKLRRENLEAYLAQRIGRARLLLVAEAAGFRGAKFSGVAMTCERLLLQSNALPHPRTSSRAVALSGTDRRLGVLEPTASIVDRTLRSSGVDPKDVILWNTFPWHPHKPHEPLTNRTPTPAEVAFGAKALREMLALFPAARLIAIGRIAQRVIHETLSLECPCVRHPANGGSTLFARGVRDLVRAEVDQ